MSGKLHSGLRPVRLRQRALYALHAAAVGLLAGSCVAVLLAVGRLVIPSAALGISPSAALACSLAGALLGGIAGLFGCRGWAQAARAVDAHYRLKDRVATALAFAEQSQVNGLRALQIDDALEHLKRVQPRDVAPLSVPRPLPYALAVLLLAVALVLMPNSRTGAQAAATEPLAEILQEAAVIEESVIPELEQLAQRERDERLEQLVEQLKEIVAEMKEPGVDVREALAKLSEMQAAVAAAQGEFNLEAVDASLKQLGQALSPAAAMKLAAEALTAGEYSEAAEQLEQFDGQKLSRKEAQSVSEQLKHVAKKMRDAGQGELSDAATELSEGIESENESQCKGGACKLAGLCKSQALRKGIGQCLGSQLATLSECKGNCQGNGQGMNGGQSVTKSNSPKDTWGLGASGQPLSDQATQIDATAKREEITGTQGAGPAEKEVSHSPEGREQATRAYREKYQQYRRNAEAVLESEPLPLGHRQTIRKYFESIRPQNEAPAAEPSQPE